MSSMIPGEVQHPQNGSWLAKTGIRGPLAQLLHALNQPLTGLQCSMEVALAGPRTPGQYVQGLREGLELTERMRALVEAIREVVDGDEEKNEELETTDLTPILEEVLEDLEPVAEEKRVRIGFECAASFLAVSVGRRSMSAVVFRFVESALSLADQGSALRIEAGGAPGAAWIRMRWQGAQPGAELARPELGLLVAQAGWERAGAQWERERTENLETVTVRLPGVSASHGNS